ncbi:hypothetical protein U1Q18_011506, partial [Sarracenia purpurea var. burkii]
SLSLLLYRGVLCPVDWLGFSSLAGYGSFLALRNRARIPSYAGKGALASSSPVLVLLAEFMFELWVDPRDAPPAAILTNLAVIYIAFSPSPWAFR